MTKTVNVTVILGRRETQETMIIQEGEQTTEIDVMRALKVETEVEAEKVRETADGATGEGGR